MHYNIIKEYLTILNSSQISNFSFHTQQETHLEVVFEGHPTGKDEKRSESRESFASSSHIHSISDHKKSGYKLSIVVLALHHFKLQCHQVKCLPHLYVRLQYTNILIKTLFYSFCGNQANLDMYWRGTRQKVHVEDLNCRGNSTPRLGTCQHIRRTLQLLSPTA